jgi:urea transport system ATP-binding protein
MLSLSNIHSFYGRSHILHDVTLRFNAGQITTVLGRNGVGKTTLLKTALGMTDRSTGKIELKGMNISAEPTFRRARAGLGYVPQGREIIPDFTIRDNIMLGTFARADARRVIPPLIGELFPYLLENLDRLGGVLSGGQQQQLAIARALASEPDVLLLDEPNEGIQPSIVEEIERTILRLNRELGLTIVLVEQNIEFARRASHQFAMIEKGRVVAQGPISQLTEELVHLKMAI